LAGATGAGLAALVVGGLTLDLNPHLLAVPRDAALLSLYLVAGAGLAGAVAGAAAALVVTPLDRLAGRWRRGKEREPFCGLAAAVLFWLPLLYLILLPDLGVAPKGLLSALLFGSTTAQRLLGLAAGTLAAAVLGILGRRAAAAAARRLGRSLRALTAGAVAAATVLLAGWAVWPPAPPATTGGGPPPELPPPAHPPPPPVVLLVIDGADLNVIEPLVARGRLPHFARLMEEGSWGPLATLEPTLSAVVWTTLATGRPPAEHGIHHFVTFRIPGLTQVVRRFPVHSGLNSRLPPLLERLPGLAALRAPATSDLRRSLAVWEMAARRYPVGVYRWLVSWPAEPVPGFYVAGGIGWAQFFSGREGEASGAARAALHPPDLFERLPPPRHIPARREDLDRILAGRSLPPDDPRRVALTSTLEDPTARHLPRLLRHFRARFAAASFYSVDPFHHFFGRDWHRGGPGAVTLEEVYRHTDQRLGELLARLPPKAQVLVVSDHGFDFVHNHHTWAPPGVFFARGPAFRRGARVDGLAVEDLAPLCLYLLDLPLPQDLAGSRSLRFRRAIRPGFWQRHPASTIASYGDRGTVASPPRSSPRDDEIREVLRSLGYVR
jgi:hypothetical protein